MKTRKMVMLALLVALALIFSYVESLIPYTFAVPGIKMGLPNIAVVFTLYRLGYKESVLISIIRIIIAALLFGNMFSLIYSVSGAVLSLIIMCLLRKTRKFRIVTVSISGAVAHNIGQILAAMIVLGTTGIVFYLPALLISGVVSGIIIGILAAIAVKRIPEKLLK